MIHPHSLVECMLDIYTESYDRYLCDYVRHTERRYPFMSPHMVFVSVPVKTKAKCALKAAVNTLSIATCPFIK